MEDAGVGLEGSLAHIEELLQRGNKLLYGDEKPGYSDAFELHYPPAENSSKKNSITSLHPINSTRMEKGFWDVVQQSENDMTLEEKRYLEIEKHFAADVRRVAKLEKESREKRKLEAKKKMEELARGIPKPRGKRGEEEQEEEQPPEEVDLDMIRERIHREVQEYRVLCSQKKGSNTWTVPVVAPEEKMRNYVSPYHHQSYEGKKWSKTGTSTSSSQLPRNPDRVKRAGNPGKNSESNHIPIWDRLYGDAISRAKQKNPAVCKAAKPSHHQGTLAVPVSDSKAAAPRRGSRMGKGLINERLDSLADQNNPENDDQKQNYGFSDIKSLNSLDLKLAEEMEVPELQSGSVEVSHSSLNFPTLDLTKLNSG